MSDILNVITQVLAYSPVQGVSDNPAQRIFDWTRRMYSLEINGPVGDTKLLAPGQSYAIFDSTRTSPLDNTSVLSLAIFDPSISLYRLSVTAGASGFRTPRSISNVTSCQVTVNNNALAVFNFPLAVISGVVPGDIMRVKGVALNDVGPFAFNPLNSGLWVVVAASGTTVQCVRLATDSFSGVSETVTTATANFQIYSSDGIQVGDKVDISGSLSSVSQRIYTISDVTPTTIDFVSALALPTETGVSFTAGTISFYSDAKKFIYIEVDQEAVVQLNADTSNNNKICPIAAANAMLIGYFHKWGSAYRCEVVNRSIFPMNLRFFTGE